ncbi:hypothetical protein G6F65_022427 [Rhizopus arrhizus]|nr:hypothetical protein G6F65_022427 [Rhizopus arrhizus]
MGVGAADRLDAGQRRHQHQQGRLGKVEVGDQRVHDAVLVARGDEQARVALGGGQRHPGRRAAFGLSGGRFQGAHAGRADGDHAAATGAGGGDGIHRGLRRREPFGVHDVGGQVVHAHRLEGRPGGPG